MRRPSHARLRLALSCLAMAPCPCVAAAVQADDVARSTEPIIFTDALAIERVGRYGRQAVHLDPIQQALVARAWTTPAAGDLVTRPDGTTAAWQAIDDIGGDWFRDPAHHNGYALVQAQSMIDQVMILHAVGHGMVYVNGEPRTGDPYRYGFVRLPVRLRQGRNEFLFHAGRGPISATLTPPSSPLMLDAGDLTLPDLMVDDDHEQRWGAIQVINASENPIGHAALEVRREDVADPTTGTWLQRLPAMGPLTTRKIPFAIRGPGPGPAPGGGGALGGGPGGGPGGAMAGEIGLILRLLDLSTASPVVCDSVEARIEVRPRGARQKHTFVSEIDGSVQYYAVVPASELSGPGRPALVLSLHGAGVEATSQAAAYHAKSWCVIVAPTNRRSFGFDWEDWGRLDALEVLEHAAARFNTDPLRVYLTGHSMGGHGTWQLGGLFPDRFAAIGPSAGWISFWSYGGAAELDAGDPVQAILKRAAGSSDTLALEDNFAMHGVYILHGDADDNVPVAQARTMVRRLADFHGDFAYHEQAGAGHWWGNACVDWPQMFAFFQARQLPAPQSMAPISFTTASPGISASCRWATIEDQLHPLVPSSVDLRYDAANRRFAGTTTNVARLALDLQALPPGEAVSVELDGQVMASVDWPRVQPMLRFECMDQRWIVADHVPDHWKRPDRYGCFKDAFGHRFVLIYGTIGTDDERAWSYAKARYDAETFWYRGNGSVDVMADHEVEPALLIGRNVIIYGNADTNAAWAKFLADSPLQVRRGELSLGARSVAGRDLACLAIRPRTDGVATVATCVGVVAGTGLVGMRLTDRLPYFVSGVGYPDLFVLGADALQRGLAGVRVAGFFGPDWSVERGEWAWAGP